MTSPPSCSPPGTGRGSRARCHKLLAPIEGGRWSCGRSRAALGAGLDETIVVDGRRRPRAGPGAAGLLDHVTLVRNDRWAEGQATSLAAAIAAAGRAGHDAIVVGLGDQPFVGPDAWRAVPPPEAADRGGHLRRPAAQPGAAGRRVWPLLPTDGRRRRPRR